MDSKLAQQNKLTDWKNEPSVADLKNDFLLAQPSHDAQLAKIQSWLDSLYVTGSAKPPKRKGRSSVQPALVRKQAEWRYSALTEPFLNSYKIFRVNPRTFEDTDAAKQNELLLNYQFDTKLNKVNLIDSIVRTTVNEGTCILRVGWERTTKQEPEQVPIYQFLPDTVDEQFLQNLQQAVELKHSNPRGYKEQVDETLQACVDYYEESGTPAMAQIIGYNQIMSEKIVENKPTVEVVNNQNIYIDPTCNGDISKALFIIMSFETNKANLIKAGNYTNLDLVDWDSNSPIADGYHDTNVTDFRFTDTVRKKVVAYEYWGYWDINGDGNLVPFVATWIGDVMIRMELNPFPDEKLPFIVIPYMPVVRSIYGEPDASLLEDNQKIVGALTRGMIDLLGKSANSQQGFAKGMLDPVNERKFKSGEDYEFNPTISPVQGYIEHKYPEIPITAINMLQMQNQEAESLTGIKSFSGGVSGDSYGQVVTGIKAAVDSAGKREMAILRRIAKGVSELGDKIIAMNAVFLSEEEVVRVTNKEFLTIQKEDLKGNFDLVVDINTAEVDNEKAQDLGFMLQTIGPNLDPTLTTSILAEIADLKRMPKLAEQLRQWKPQPNPLEEKAKELEIAKLESEVNLNNAKAAETQSKTDGNVIDNQMEITGTKHRQEMEKQQAQARANQNLEVTKALVKSRKEGEKEPNVEAAIGFNAITPRLSNI